jgi:type II secretory pathway component PulF
MPTFRYTAKNAQRQSVDGQVEAADMAAARAKLAADGLDVELIEPTEPQAAGGEAQSADATARPTTKGDAAALTDHLAALARADLPLAPGLRALADQMTASRLKRDIAALADRLEAGVSLADALDGSQRSIPPYLRGAIIAGLRTGQLGNVLEEVALQQQANRDVTRGVWTALAYPLFVLGLLLVLVLVMMAWIVPLFADIFSDFGLDLPVVTQFVIALSAPQWPLLGLVLLVLLMGLIAVGSYRPSWSPTNVLFAIPLIGPLWAWSGMTEFCRLLGTLLRFEVPLPEALRLTADGIRDPGIGRASRRLAQQVEHGQALASGVAQSRLFPRSLVALIRWGQQIESLPKALLMAGEIYADRVRYQSMFVKTALPPILLIVVLIVVGFSIAALFIPLIDLLQGLT